VEGNHVALLRNGEEAFPAMLAAIETAKEQVLLEMYWFASDSVGDSFAEALLRARQRGVEVAVLYDALGSRSTALELFQKLESASVHVIEFNPVAPWRKRFAVDGLWHRDHRKLLIVDHHVGFTGGINLAQEWLPADGSPAWRDDMIRVDGPVVLELIDCFLEAWEAEGGPPLGRALSVKAPTAAGSHRVRVLGQSFFRNRRDIARAYRKQIYQSRETVFISNSYFIPDRSVIRALCLAAQRGVDVRVLVPGVSDVPMIRYASRAVWGRLLRAGVRLFEWQGEVLHAKTAVIDESWSTVGTFNLDQLSLRNNLEVNVSVEDSAFGKVMGQSFLMDLESSHEVLYERFRYRPLWDRLLERIAYRFRKFL
jgi:cardiolipin synthase